MALKDIKAANNAKTELAQAISPTDTAFIVKDSSKFPDAPFRITIDAEIMEVGKINKSTNTLSEIIRGIEGTIATNHELGASVENRWTAGTLQILIDSITNLDTRLTNLTEISKTFAPRGIISMWSGKITDIPDGWALCDGHNGTPNLQDKFIVAAGKDYSVGDVGGQKTVTLTADQMPRHTHDYTLSVSYDGDHTHRMQSVSGSVGHVYGAAHQHDFESSYASTESAGTHKHNITGSILHTGKGLPHDNIPPYYALAYIMKL